MKYIEEIKKNELFSALENDELEIVSNFFKVKIKNKGQFLFKENELRKSFYIVLSGQIELISNLNDPTSIITSFYPSDFFGEGSLLDSYPHSTSSVAKINSKLLYLSKENFNEIIDTYPKLASKILASVTKVISRRLAKMATNNVGSSAVYVSGKMRKEKDLLGERDVPDEAYYGIQTLRGRENFMITGVPISHYSDLIIALAQIKQAAARANRDTGVLEEKIAKAIDDACEQIINYKYHIHFVVDVIQGGAGTSTNMNANEVIANRALELMGYKKGEYEHCHPNNHVNLSQSTNDVYPCALKLATYYKNNKLIEVIIKLIDAFKSKGKEFGNVIKMGRTQLQDAVPMTLGQEFDAYAYTLAEDLERLKMNAVSLLEMNLGGTAIGTGINADKRYAKLAIWYLQEITNLPVKNADNLIEASQDTGVFILYSSVLKRLAIRVSKICNDLRLLSSGPRAGLNEINLPPMQPGSSIMPGKVNPVIPEVVNQVCYNLIGNDLTITMASEAGQLQLNVMEPVIAQSLFEMMDTMTNALQILRTKCIEGITANEEICKKYVQNSIGIVTALNPIIGYENSSSIAKEALNNGTSVYDIVLQRGLMSKEKLDEILSPENMI